MTVFSNKNNLLASGKAVFALVEKDPNPHYWSFTLSVVELEPYFLAGAGAGEKALDPAPGC